MRLLSIALLVLTLAGAFDRPAEGGLFFRGGPIRRFLFFGGPIRRRMFAPRMIRRGFCGNCGPRGFVRPRCGNGGVHLGGFGGACGNRNFRDFQNFRNFQDFQNSRNFNGGNPFLRRFNNFDPVFDPGLSFPVEPQQAFPPSFQGGRTAVDQNQKSEKSIYEELFEQGKRLSLSDLQASNWEGECESEKGEKRKVTFNLKNPGEQASSVSKALAQETEEKFEGDALLWEHLAKNGSVQQDYYFKSNTAKNRLYVKVNSFERDGENQGIRKEYCVLKKKQ